ncbi:MAG: methyl-accepting chemotaxis protein [Pseudobdellovibrio sp.]
MKQILDKKNIAVATSSHAGFFLAASDLIAEAQTERGKTSMFIAGKMEKSNLDQQRKKVDLALEQFRKEIPAISFNKSSLDVIQNIFLELESTRKSADEKSDSKAIASNYSNIIKNIVQLEVAISRMRSIEGIDVAFSSLIMLEIAKENAGKLRANITNILAANKAISDETSKMLESFYANIISNLDSPVVNLSASSAASINKFKESKDWLYVLTSYGAVSKHYNSGEYGIPADQFFEAITRSINDLGSVVRDEMRTIIKSSEAAKNETTTTFIQVLAAALLISAGLIVFSWKFIVSFSNQLIQVSNDLLEKADEVSEASLQLNESSQSLSASVAEQAAGLQQSVASIEEISAMINKNADNSKNTLDLSTSNLKTASDGKETVGVMQVSIVEINESNAAIMKQIEASNQEMQTIVNVINEIGTKTQVINDIVFQTKLLSFNASVEAARAGEQGKGFAVVAEEVGNLAQMSGNAAKEISLLLKGSIEKVEGIVNQTREKVDVLIHQGQEKVTAANKTAGECAEILDSVCSRANDMNRMVGEIAAASEEQALGVQEINKAMGQLETTTHQNSSAAQQSSNVAEILSKQAVAMKSSAELLTLAIYGKK